MIKNNETYLHAILESQTLGDDNDEMKKLREQRDQVEAILKDAFPAAIIRYGGSKAKRMLIKESYDLDIVCYFSHDETAAGTTLKDLYLNVSKTLSRKYWAEDKTSAIRLLSGDPETKGTYTHIDVVPGRYTDATNSGCYLHQNGGSKERLKTNLDVHISHIRDSGVTDALKLLKLWRVLNGLEVKQFAFELLGVEILRSKKNASLADQLQYFFQTVSEAENPIKIEDPANPTGNDLMPLLTNAWPYLRTVADKTLTTIGHSGWDFVYGQSGAVDSSATIEQLSAAVYVSRQHQPTKPWSA